jgi:hypothetical protein
VQAWEYQQLLADCAMLLAWLLLPVVSQQFPAVATPASIGNAVKSKKRLFLFTLFWLLAGPLSQTHRELWTALSQSRALANMSLPAVTQAEAALNNQTVALLASLLAQSGSNSGSGTELGIANGVWTKQLPVLKGFADNMWRLYRVSCLGCCNCNDASISSSCMLVRSCQQRCLYLGCHL